MNREDFDKLVEDTVKATADLLIAKGDEYAGDADRLANFKRNAIKNGQTVLETWQTYWGKHIDSINTYMARVKDKAVFISLQFTAEDYATLLERLPTPGAQSISDKEKKVAVLDPAKFKKRINENLPVAMRLVDSELSEPIEGRFHDNINYSYLCIALLKELREIGA
jgi:hypothetical protein